MDWWSLLSGSFFDLFWEDGVAGAKRGEGPHR
jgi:hypothetical protein